MGRASPREGPWLAVEVGLSRPGGAGHVAALRAGARYYREVLIEPERWWPESPPRACWIRRVNPVVDLSQ